MTEENTQEVTQEAQPQAESPAPEVDVNALQAKLTQLETEKAKYEANWKNEQRNVSKKDQELQRIREQLESNESQVNMTKAMIAILANQQQRDPDEVETDVKQKQPDLLKQFEAIEKKSKTEREIRKAQERVKSLQDRTEALGLKPTDRDYKAIQKFAITGDYTEAEQWLTDLESKQPSEKKIEGDKTMTEEKKDAPKIDEAAEEKIALEYMKKKGLLKAGGVQPSGSGLKIPTNKADLGKFIQGLSDEEYKKLKPEINKAMANNQIK